MTVADVAPLVAFTDATPAPGVADPELGERVAAAVVARTSLDPDDLRAWCRQQLAAYKVPKTVELVDAIPRSEATKVSRSALIAEREPRT